MTPERIKAFLKSFYEVYVLDCFEGFEVASSTDEMAKKMEQYDVKAYFLNHLEIYVESIDYQKEYNRLYNNTLFYASRDNNPEVFNELEIFLIENIQLFLHTILEAGLNTHVSKDKKVEDLKIFLKPIDNKSIKLLELIDKAEEKMKVLQILPPAMG